MLFTSATVCVKNSTHVSLVMYLGSSLLGKSSGLNWSAAKENRLNHWPKISSTSLTSWLVYGLIKGTFPVSSGYLMTLISSKSSNLSSARLLQLSNYVISGLLLFLCSLIFRGLRFCFCATMSSSSQTVIWESTVTRRCFGAEPLVFMQVSSIPL
jgi:hypothetical protein